MRRVLRLVLQVALVGSVLLVLPTAGAQAACDVTVSNSNVTVGQAITITGFNFKGGTSASLLVDGTPVHTGITSRDGAISTSYSFSAAGTYLVWATGLDQGSNSCSSSPRQVQVSAPAPTTTTAPPTTTTTTTTPVFGVAGECWVEFDFGKAGNVVAPGAAFEVRGGGFAADTPVMIGTPFGGEEWASVTPDADGGFEVEVTVPDWPEAAYLLVARQSDALGGGCSGWSRVLLDRAEDPVPGTCSIRVLQVTDETAPFFMRGAYVTYGMGFTPGEMVTMSRDGAVVSGPLGPVGADGTFVAPFVPPMDYAAGPVEWLVRTRSCVASAMVTPYSGDSPLAITPEALAGGGVLGVFGQCELIVYKENLTPVPGVDPSYQSPVAQTFIVAFGKGFTPGEKVGFLVDGQPLDLIGPTLYVDDAGKFYTDSGSTLTNLKQVAQPYVLTAQTESCTASAFYVEFPEFEVPVDDSGWLLATVVAEGPVPLVGIGNPMWLSLDDCGIVLWRGFPYFSNDPDAMPDPPPGVPLGQWAYGNSVEMYVWGHGFTPGESVEGYIDGHEAGLSIKQSDPPVVTETVQDDGAIGRFVILNAYTDSDGVYHEDWAMDGGLCGSPCQFTLEVVTPSCTASASYTEFDPPDFPVPVEDTIPIPGPPGGEVVLPVARGPDDGLVASEMVALALVGLGGVLGGFFGGSALAARGKPGGLSHPPPDDNISGGPGVSQSPPPDDNISGGPGVSQTPPPDDNISGGPGVSQSPPPDDQMPSGPGVSQSPPPDDQMPSGPG